MKTGTVVAALASLGLLASAATSSAAPLYQRSANISQRIDQGIRNGSLTRREAYQLRNRLHRIQRTEYQYRRGGLSGWERRDLQRRYDSLSNEVRGQRHDSQSRY